jgi:lipid II isoglutaminyl synthase (glutamine-hydrolysing)
VSRTLRTSLAIGAGRATGWLSRATGRGQGATISGRVMNAIAPDLLRELADGQHVAIVSATNGKTTTTRLLAAAVAADGRRVVSNSTGANLTSGIAPTLARADGPGTAILEVDERVLERVVDPLGVRLCVFGNLSRDQLDRYGEVHAVGDAWRRVSEAHPDLAVVANASDPHVVWAAAPAKVTWVDLGLRWRQDAATCPSCGELLTWSEHRFDCASCGFAQPDAPHRLDGDALVLDGRRIPLELQLPGAWNLANAALALVAAATHFGIDPTAAAQAMRDVESVAGRFMRVPLGDGRHVTVVLSKNPAGWSEALRLVADRPGAGVVIAVNARVADGKDPSWLWDVPYEWLAGHPVAAAGERRLDVAVRLQYADLAPTVDVDPLDAARALDADELYVIASYTQFSALFRKHGTPEQAAA